MDNTWYYNPNNNNPSSSLNPTLIPSSSPSQSSTSSRKAINNNGKKSTTTTNNKKGVVKLSTDPQSVAARERRHRISDRFKTLQSLVPGGAKLDTVSMLEQAIQYVKFLKAQIWLHQAIINNNNNNNSNHNYQHNLYDYYDNDHNKSRDLFVNPNDVMCSYHDQYNNNNNNINNNINRDGEADNMIIAAPQVAAPAPDFSGYQMLFEGNDDDNGNMYNYKRSSIDYYG